MNNTGRMRKSEISWKIGQKIFEYEVTHTVNQMNGCNSSGHDELCAEILEPVDIKELTYLFIVKYNFGELPLDYLTPTTKQLLKTYRLINNALKEFLRVIHSRMYKKCEDMSEETQFIFIKGLGTSALLIIRRPIRKKIHE